MEPSIFKFKERRKNGRNGKRRRLLRPQGRGRAHYSMTQELLSIGDDYWIEDENGDKASMWMARHSPAQHSGLKRCAEEKPL